MEQKKRFKPKLVCISDDKAYKAYKKQNLMDKNITGGYEGLLELCDVDIDLVLNSIMGYKGLYMSIKLIENKIDLALSNKESIVQAGSILTKLAKEKKVNIFPVDSEHSALWQCIIGEKNETVDKLILTGSGGPFRTLEKNKFKSIKEASIKTS